LPTKSKSEEVILSIVTPAFNEEKNLPLLYVRLKKSLDQLGVSWEWVVVDDHSVDGTYKTLEKLATKDKRVRGIRFTKNLGSHLALVCGFKAARGRSAVCMAADLQDPPELIGQLVSKWKEGYQIVWAVRAKREGESFGTQFFSRLYYFIVRYVVGFKQIPPAGADFLLLDRLVLNTLAKAKIRNASLFLLISSFPFKQGFINYVKQERAYGQSGWSFKKKLKLFFDSITMFSKAPIYWTLGMGMVCLAGALVFFSRDIVTQGSFYLGMFFVLAVFFMIGVGAALLRRLDETLQTETAAYVIEKRTN